MELPGGALWTIQGLVASVRNWILFELEMTFSSSSSATGGNPQSGFACGVFVALYGCLSAGVVAIVCPACAGSAWGLAPRSLLAMGTNWFVSCRIRSHGEGQRVAAELNSLAFLCP